MRNLSLHKSVHAELGQFISAVSVDPDQDALYVAVELHSNNDLAQIEIWKVFEGEDEVELHISTRITTYSVPVSISSNPWCSVSSPLPGSHEVVDMRLLPDTRTLVFITYAGDIVSLALEDDDTQPEVVGSVDAGIIAATWSPDASLLVLVTGDDKLILMTSTFDVLSEGLLHPEEFGEDAPIALGWGAKHTQFHGSLGKSAAQAAVDLAAVGTSPDDDGRPRVSWRGDGAFFVVSAVLPASPPETARPRRTLRVYSRDGALSSTAEPLAGLEHTLAWRPSGNLIASVQRFGSKDGLGKGREGRHDVVFFERNGLRHGEFGLREQGQMKNKAEPRGRDSAESDETAMTATEKSADAKRNETVRRWGYRVRGVGWSADSSVLSVWIESDDGDVVQLWTIGNYHWYLKQEIAAPPAPSGGPGRFTTVTWHPEDALRIILTTPSDVIQRTYGWETFSSLSKPPIDTGTVAVLDGTNILLTPFRTQNVPPPMFSHILALSKSTMATPRTQVPIHASLAPTRDFLAVVWESGDVEVFNLHTRIDSGRRKVMDPTKLWDGSAVIQQTQGAPRSFRQIIALSPGDEEHSFVDQEQNVRFAALAAGANHKGRDFVSVVTLKGGEVLDKYEVGFPARNGRLVSADKEIIWQGPDGELFVAHNTRVSSAQARLPEFCFSAIRSPLPLPAEGDKTEVSDTHIPAALTCGLSQSGKLHVAADGNIARTLAGNVTSFTVASGFLIFTTTTHVAQFAPLDALVSLCRQTSVDTPETSLPDWETRRVERGSRIVTAIPSTMSLVLQMPRGNLETINPRPLVMEIVRQEIDSGNYGKAFMACRKHRIDLNVLVEHNRAAFKERLSSFVDQVDDVDHINLFLTSLGQGSLPAEIVAEMCDGVRTELERRDLKKYVNSILTAHVVKKSPDHEAGLALLLRLRDSEPQVVEDAVKYIIFLVDADKLFDTALGMYDFSLVLMIAQHAQKDPREYLPFLRELRALDHHYQRFRIDDYLKRYEKALDNLSRAGPERFDEAMAYVEKHQLYDRALSIWRGTDHYHSILDIYGDWLFDRRRFKEAAFVFRQGGKWPKSMIAHEKALDWQELFEIALAEKMAQEDIASTAYRVGEDLCSKKRYSEAARVLLDYAQDVTEAVKALVEGSQFSEARRVVALKSQPELLHEVVYPGALDSRAQIAEDLNEMKDQLRKQLQRIRELRVRKVEEPDAFYGVEDVDLHNVDVMTDISMAPTAFTRYTQAPSSVSRTTSKRSSRSKRKLERKVGSGRKGTVDEEEYLLKSITKLVGRFNTTQADAVNLLPHLFQFSEKHQAEGHALQEELSDFEAELGAAVEEIWKRPSSLEGEDGGDTGDSWATRMREHERQRQTDPLEKVERPKLANQEWKLSLPTD